MTIKELRQKPIGVLETREFIIKADDHEYKDDYYLVKVKDDRYFIGFSDDRSYCSNRVSEERMVHLINDKESSDGEAAEIYFSSPQLSCCIH